MVHVVELGSIIEFDKVIPILTALTWQQNFAKRTKNFYFIVFKIEDRNAGGYLAVEEQYWDMFMGMVTDCKPENDRGWTRQNPRGQLKVTNDFRYGQNSEKTFRFLVLGNKLDNIYQHRFAEAFQNWNSTDGFQNQLRILGAAADALLKSSIVTDMAKAYIGDPLREF